MLKISLYFSIFAIILLFIFFRNIKINFEESSNYEYVKLKTTRLEYLLHILILFIPVLNITLFILFIIEIFKMDFIADKDKIIYKIYRAIANRLNKLLPIKKIKSGMRKLKVKLEPFKVWLIEEEVEL